MLNILLVDDETSERDGISYLIKKYNLPLNIAEAYNGKKALEYIKSNQVDILLTDIKMPYMDGLELAKETFQYDKNIKIIIFSAYGEFEYAKKAFEANAVNYLLKPIELSEFEKVMKEVIHLCEEQKTQKEYQQNLEEADKKVLFYKLLTGGYFNEIEKKQLNHNLKVLEEKWIVLINIETQKSIFEEKESVFLTLVKTYMKYSYEYVNIYPNAAYLILKNKNRMNLETIEDSINLLNRDIKLLLNDSVSFVVSENFNDINLISTKADILNSIRNSIYDYDRNILFESILKNNTEFYAEEIEYEKNEIMKAIDEKDLGKINILANNLIQSLVKNNSVSKIYVNHIFYGMINKLYVKFGFYDKTLIHKQIEKLLRCRDGKDLETVFHEILKEVTSNYAIKEEDSKGIAYKVIKIIESEYMNDLSLEYIAEKINFAPSYLSYIFKKETGSNIIKYITDYRMEKAKKLLEEGKLKIVQVGKACGYENQSYFNRLFKNYYGLTPKQMKENMS